jgi:hypothetical protein
LNLEFWWAVIGKHFVQTVVPLYIFLTVGIVSSVGGLALLKARSIINKALGLMIALTIAARFLPDTVYVFSTEDLMVQEEM